MTLIVHRPTCTYMLVTNPFLNVVETDPDGDRFESVVQVVQVWAGSHLDLDAFSPLGFAGELLQGSAEEPPVGAATVFYQLVPE